MKKASKGVHILAVLGGVTLPAMSIVFSETSNDPRNSVDKQKRDKKRYTSKYNQEDPSPRRFNFREALGDDPHKSNPRHASPAPGERAGFGKSDRDGKKNRIRVFVAPWIFAQLAGSSATSMTPRLLWMVFANPAL